MKRIAANDDIRRSAPFGGQTLALRWYLVWLVAGTLLPIVVFAVFVVYRLSSQAELASERRALLAARNLASTVDRELTSTARTLQALASSQQLDQGNFQQFYLESKRVIQNQDSWLAVILLNPDGQQLINTRQPFGAPLGKANEPASLQRVVQSRQPTVGNLANSRMEPAVFGIPVRIPVMRNQQLQYVLTAVLTQKAIAQVVMAQDSIEGEWTRTVVDGQGIVVARTRNPERFVGRPGTPSFLKRIAQSNEGVYRDTTLEGVKVYVAFSRVRDSHWTAAVTVPVDVIQGPSQQALTIVVVSGSALLLLSGIGAFMLSWRISQSIHSATLAAAALASGEVPNVRSLSIKEVALLGQSLELTARLLAQREQERTENLLRAEAAREEAEAANRIKDEFLAVLSHELRTPLNPILGWSKLLRSGTLDPTKTAFALETIERNAKLQTQLIEDLLDVARIMQGKLSLKMTPVNLVGIIEATIETVRLAAEAKSIQVKTVLTSTRVTVLGDPTRLQQVVWNLLSNAIKFTPEGGQVQIQLALVNTQAQIQVTDTGKGIAPTFLPYVFEYFRQEDGKTTRKFGGLGLGLAIVRHLVELHGGTVQAESLGEDRGSTFTVQLPLMNVEQQRREEQQEQLSPLYGSAALRNMQILLVDDDADTREVMTFILTQQGAIVTAAESARAVLKALDQTRFDLLISDIGMPEMDGYTLIQAIRRRPAAAGGTIPAIALTAYAGDFNQQQVLQAGFQHHIAKPTEPDAFIQAVETVLSRHISQTSPG